ncbi:MAG: hypothetical protein KGH69_03965 [Candidatus Micrarchaeota archaeon]|nr:hypothetical protein [Candidatus Micrarchaeota archaeon]
MANNLMVAGIAIVIVVVAAGAFLYTSSSSSGGLHSGTNGNAASTGTTGSGNGAQASTTMLQTGAQGSTAANASAAGAGSSPSGTQQQSSGTLSGYQPAQCGSGNSCVSNSEAVSLIGSGGNYQSGYLPDFASSMAKAEAVSGGNYSDYVYTNNITSLYVVVYNFTPTNSSPQAYLKAKSLIETVFVSPHPKALYDYNLNQSFGYFNVTNATLNGLTYSYLGSNGQYGFSSSELIGYKNGEFVSFISPNAYIDPTTLATVVSKDMP